MSTPHPRPERRARQAADSVDEDPVDDRSADGGPHPVDSPDIGDPREDLVQCLRAVDNTRAGCFTVAAGAVSNALLGATGCPLSRSAHSS